ncbi:GreA/GreB family elongation factor [Cyclobacterium amurskyense]|uniref:Transcription elongation factor GreB n=1 Tax=Cyclobacterium amurskyense TaxID=320787 RepID=A0A0H4PGV0_9BACT|nr:GreA/GreB family elongation factor [Cyclobacterium amurskyense]AKP52058.1 Transcription elongation factor GreB [Cyclobacterium amurskyense]|tara:strand:+ start:1413 stop:1913 length:501 start_codon:yes stop_codon:yes gene_type:complete
MSRGFVKEDDQEEIPMVPPRADLPEGISNYVTRIGLNELLEEKERLIAEREQLDYNNEKERRIAFNHINAKLQLLNSRINSAIIVDFGKQPQNVVRFGAMVTLKIGDETKLNRYQIVGVDEADVSKGKISFISPIARLLIDKKVGDKAILKLANADRVFEIMEISY